MDKMPIRGYRENDPTVDEYYIKGKYIWMTGKQYKQMCKDDPSILEETSKLMEYIHQGFGCVN